MQSRISNIDIIRGLAALLVCAGHLRAFLFVDYSQVTSPGIIERAFYLLTGLGHQAVVIFFVLSGYLVGGSVVAAVESGRWSWKTYALRRLTRLWVVLGPALLLTLALDSLGRHLGAQGYSGVLHALYNSGPSLEAPTDLRLATLLGNLFFTQTIAVNCFGTNGPLWSLANEFWYYVLFPLLGGAVAGGSTWSRIGHGLVFAFLVWWLPVKILLGGLIWLMGVGAYALARNERWARFCGHPAWILGGGLLTAATLMASKTRSPLGTDWVVGLTFSAWLVGLAQLQPKFSLLRKLGQGLSDMSYTLYLVHMPVLALLFFTWAEGHQHQPAPVVFAVFVALLCLVVAVAWAFWWCFERNTDRIRKKIEGLLPNAAPLPLRTPRVIQ